VACCCKLPFSRSSPDEQLRLFMNITECGSSARRLDCLGTSGSRFDFQADEDFSLRYHTQLDLGPILPPN
jgi:hypothetical protein